MTNVNKEAILEWVEALESGEYKQTTGALGAYDPEIKSYRYCCLGVVCDLFKNRLNLRLEEVGEILYFEGYSDQLPRKVYTFLGLPYGNPEVSYDSDFNSLAELNDIHNKTFSEIAAILRANFLNEETNA